ncbi:MAG: hypothetical protein N3G22_03045 [Candidatus Micrarchaeota archaeon]|nr:hypothetical protein [Candidatus Micrarchaeota archaeon]
MEYLLAAYCSDALASSIGDIVVLSFALMIAIIALSYMAAYLFRKPEYEGFAQIEMYQLVVSAMIFALVYGAVCFAADLADLFAGKDVFEIGRSYLVYIQDMAVPHVINLELAKLNAQALGSWSMRWGASVWGVIVPAFPSFVLVERVLDFLLLLISPFTASLIVQMIILEVIRGTVLTYVLPAGVVLRIFPPTRDAGAFLISSAIGFGIIYPYTYAMHKYIVEDMINHEASPTLKSRLENAGFQNIFRYISFKGMLDWEEILIRPLKYLSYLLLQALFLPALSITLTIAFIKGTAKFISQKMG